MEESVQFALNALRTLQRTSLELVSAILDWVPPLCALNQRRRLILQPVHAGRSSSFKIVKSVLQPHDLVVTSLTETRSSILTDFHAAIECRKLQEVSPGVVRVPCFTK